MAKRKRRNGLAPTAKFFWQEPDWDLANEIGGITESQRINEHRPPFTSLAKTIPLSKLNAEPTCLASDEPDPESVLELIHQVEEDDNENCGDSNDMPAPVTTVVRARKRKKLLRRKVTQQPERQVQPSDNGDVDYLLPPASSGNLVPIVSRDLYGWDSLRYRRRHGVRGKKEHLGWRYNCSKKNPGFRKWRRLVLGQKHSNLAA